MKVAGFVAALAAVFGVALLIGKAVGPADESVASHAADHLGHETPTVTTSTAANSSLADPHAGHEASPPPDPHAGHDSTPAPDPHAGHGGTAPETASAPSTSGSAVTNAPGAAPSEDLGGLMDSQSGYTFSLADHEVPAGQDVPLTFTIDGPDGRPVTGFDIAHDKQLHLIVVRHDFHGFQHVHPTLAADGTWSVAVDLDAGSWRLYADFTATGSAPLTLGTDLTVSGSALKHEPLPQTRTAEVDGYTVTLDGDLTAGADTMLSLRVTREGKPVTDLQPYLAAYGHLVALRDTDMAYLHVHPDGAPGDGSTAAGPDIVFHTSIPTAGKYYLYLDSQHDGVVRTAQFVVTAGGS